MKKHFSRAMAMLLAIVMVFSLLPVAALAADVRPNDGAAFFNGMPGDGTYGVIYSCGEGYSHVMGYDINAGDAASKAVTLTDDKEAINQLPDGTAIFKFVKLDDKGTYYLTLGGCYAALGFGGVGFVQRCLAAQGNPVLLCACHLQGKTHAGYSAADD